MLCSSPAVLLPSPPALLPALMHILRQHLCAAASSDTSALPGVHRNLHATAPTPSSRSPPSHCPPKLAWCSCVVHVVTHSLPMTAQGKWCAGCGPDDHAIGKQRCE